MNNLKDFWAWADSMHGWNVSREHGVILDEIKTQQGLFFWERGGKEFVQRLLKDKWTIEEIIDSAKTNFNICPTKCWYGLANNFVIQKQDFLDALDCLGEDKIKELLHGGETK